MAYKWISRPKTTRPVDFFAHSRVTIFNKEESAKKSAGQVVLGMFFPLKGQKKHVSIHFMAKDHSARSFFFTFRSACCPPCRMCKKKSGPGGPWPPKGGIDGPERPNKGIRRRRGGPPRVRFGERTTLPGPEPPSKFQAIRSGSDASRPGPRSTAVERTAGR